MKPVITVILILALSGCREKNTSDPETAFKYWSGNTAPSELHLRKAKYWESSHWTKEYVIYLELEPDVELWNDYIKSNSLSINDRKWVKQKGTPTWFNPPSNSTSWSSMNALGQGTRFFKDENSGVCWIYDIQL